jgi:hypothetical protein
MTTHTDHNSNQYITSPDTVYTPQQTSINKDNRGNLNTQTKLHNIVYSNRQSERKIVPREKDVNSDGMRG